MDCRQRAALREATESDGVEEIVNSVRGGVAVTRRTQCGPALAQLRGRRLGPPSQPERVQADLCLSSNAGATSAIAAIAPATMVTVVNRGNLSSNTPALTAATLFPA